MASLEELKKELKFLEETPFYISKDGMPSPWILLILITGIIPGLIIMGIIKSSQKEKLRKKIKELEK